MIEIGRKAPEFRGEGSTVKGIVDGLKYNKIFVCSTAGVVLDLGTANAYKLLSPPMFDRWKVIGMGMHWWEASTANEDPAVEFGRYGDGDAYGKMTSAITGGERFRVEDHQKYDPLNILAQEVIAETSATLAVTWTEGVEFNVWQDKIRFLRVVEAAVAGMTSGGVAPYIAIEVDTGGKW